MSYALQDFDADVLRRSQEIPVLVDFWAEWCGPCRALTPVLEGMAASAGGKWALVKINTDEHPGLAEAYQIASIPNVKLFRNGTVVDEFHGFQGQSEIQAWLDRHLPSPATLRLEMAAEHIDEGRVAEAKQLLTAALAEEPHRAAAKILLAEILLAEDPPKALDLLAEIPADADERPHADALAVLVQAVQRPPDSLPDDPVRLSVVEGLNAVRQRDWDAALAGFTEAVERRRAYADQLALTAGKAIFRYLGIRHPTAEKYYRRFSSAANA